MNKEKTRLSTRLLRLASQLETPKGYPRYVHMLDWVAGRLAERGM